MNKGEIKMHTVIKLEDFDKPGPKLKDNLTPELSIKDMIREYYMSHTILFEDDENADTFADQYIEKWIEERNKV